MKKQMIGGDVELGGGRQPATRPIRHHPYHRPETQRYRRRPPLLEKPAATNPNPQPTAVAASQHAAATPKSPQAQPRTVLNRLGRLLKGLWRFVKNLPYRQIWQAFERIPVKRRYKFATVGVMAGALFFVISSSLGGNSVTGNTLPATDQRAAQPPSFDARTPDNKNISEFGGWSVVSPPGTEPVYGFVTQIDGVNVKVSQQPLPNDFKSNPAAKVDELASSFNASTIIDTGNTQVHIGSASNGIQSVIFYIDDVLFLVRSDAIVSNQNWVSLVDSLK